jgi:hypothetical protein
LINGEAKLAQLVGPSTDHPHKPQTAQKFALQPSINPTPVSSALSTMMRIIALLLGVLAIANADLLSSGEEMLVCDHVEGNACFEKPSSWKFQMIAALVGEAFSGDGDRRLIGTPVDASLDESIESSADSSEMSLRGSVERRDLNMCAIFRCHIYPGSYICGLFDCRRRTETGCTTSHEFSMEELLSGYTKPRAVERCIKDVQCTLEMPC